MQKTLGGDLLLATIPAPEVVREFSLGLQLPAGSHDVYLAYANTCGSRFAGYLISVSGRIDQLIAFCPIPADLAVASSLWHREIIRQREIARTIAMRASLPRAFADALWLADTGDTVREIPTWIYALNCVPLKPDWDGRVVQPRPFSPDLFATMAKQPQAQRWIMQQLLARAQTPNAECA